MVALPRVFFMESFMNLWNHFQNNSVTECCDFSESLFFPTMTIKLAKLFFLQLLPDKVTAKCEVANKPENHGKNRFINIKACEFT